ncbi:MAG: type I glyceraldehyde-3-phosphate dehydrogenase, partial [Flavobacteriales bacterium]
MHPLRIGINGFGRIGRALTRILINDDRFQIVGINDPSNVEVMAHLLRYDSVHGKLDKHVEATERSLRVGEYDIPFFSFTRPDEIPWSSVHADIVVECSGQFKTTQTLRGHLDAGARRVLLSVPPEDESIKTVVLGINDHCVTPSDLIISNASCTTNNAAPMIQLIDELCGIESCYITTVHSYTSDQRLQDSPHKDLRRSRAAALSIIPTTTGAAKAVTRIFPHLRDKMGGCGFRVPVPDGSLTDITCNVRNPMDIAFINAAFKEASHNRWNGILSYTEDPIVSADIIGNTTSCLFDAQLTSVIGNMVKVVGWYDNE